jgi:prepilin-type N-terminal cleavage/methylation domain-containing protein
MGGVMSNKGFTLIELVLVISILALMAASALPKFIDIGHEASLASKDGVVGAIQTGVQLYKAERMVKGLQPINYPQQLDNALPEERCSASNLCFGSVLANGIADERWAKIDNTHYFYVTPNEIYYNYTYSPATGKFEEEIYVY